MINGQSVGLRAFLRGIEEESGKLKLRVLDNFVPFFFIFSIVGRWGCCVCECAFVYVTKQRRVELEHARDISALVYVDGTTLPTPFVQTCRAAEVKRFGVLWSLDYISIHASTALCAQREYAVLTKLLD